MKIVGLSEKPHGFSIIQQHKRAAEVLRAFLEKKNPWQAYADIALQMGLISISPDNFEELSNRYHWHLNHLNASWKEHNLLYKISKEDKPSDVNFLDIAIYLDNMRSAFNVGSILRTIEAFRLGKVYFSGTSPFIDNPKVQKTSMRAHTHIQCFQDVSLDELPRPIIGLETAENSPSIYDFSFPETFTLALGNEEYGLSSSTLQKTDILVHIPLVGFKNSINVASALAIAAAFITKQQRSLEKK
jgi:tRNA G18 (ribose-2'-O)-methylase SpoU